MKTPKEQKYQDSNDRIITAYFFNSNVQWEIEGKKEKRVESKSKFIKKAEKWKILDNNKK